MIDEKWEEKKHERVFENTIAHLEYQREHNREFTISFLEDVLQNLYRQEGCDWTGRGEVGHITTAATIAAHEHFLAEWKKEISRR